MALVFLALALLALAWPVFAAAGLVFVVIAALALRRDPDILGRASALRRAGWFLAAGAAFTAAAVYGRGLAATTFGLLDPDDGCMLRRPEGYDHRVGASADGSSSMWPLRDTTCGPDLVPGYVNPLVAGSAVLFVVLLVVLILAEVRSRPLPAGDAARR
ncbi:hypothetical protein KBX35_11000 [Micromonospora sp. C32]|uniref:hypothetical protein n=1 Tax=unclassified Micromonospora TaxID=2617518 RepID=UPI001B387F94|nr:MULTISPECIES: hypothetical protein [unclassified Micromonospora]MBQ1044117.1 hypothetical protein [Micromonospora sp. C72]MBQ1055310.1 hypothetical protein [Micromonospora sp. C32]